jgi:hypothetical protein
LPERIAKRRPAGYASFISLAGWLQVVAGDRPIMVPVEDTAEILEVDPSCISRYRRWAVEDGFLKEVGAYERPQGRRKGKATEFRFAVSLFPALAEVAHRGCLA